MFGVHNISNVLDRYDKYVDQAIDATISQMY